MERKYIITARVLILMMILLSACEKHEFIWGKKIGGITYSGNVVFLGSGELEVLKEVTSNGIVFGDKIGEIKNITESSILVMGISEKTPYGLLRKVSNLKANGTDLVITTTDAQLDDAVKEGTITFKEKLLERDFRLKSIVEGAIVKGPSKSFDGLAVTLDNMEIYKDGINTARLNGAIGIIPEIDISIEIQFNKIKSINIETTLNKIDEVTVSSNAAFNGEKEIVAADFIHTPVIIDSLVFVPEINIICGFKGTVSSEVSSGVRQDRIITSKMDYVNSRWFGDPLVHTESFDFMKPQLTDNSDLQIYSGPEITIRLFGVPVQIVKATGFYSLQAEKTGSPFWKLFIGNDGQNSVKRDILGLSEDFAQAMVIDVSEIGNANDQ